MQRNRRRAGERVLDEVKRWGLSETCAQGRRKVAAGFQCLGLHCALLRAIASKRMKHARKATLADGSYGISQKVKLCSEILAIGKLMAAREPRVAKLVRLSQVSSVSVHSARRKGAGGGWQGWPQWVSQHCLYAAGGVDRRNRHCLAEQKLGHRLIKQINTRLCNRFIVSNQQDLACFSSVFST